MANEETKQVYAYFDRDGNGTMEYDDFINMVYREEVSVDEWLGMVQKGESVATRQTSNN